MENLENVRVNVASEKVSFQIADLFRSLLVLLKRHLTGNCQGNKEKDGRLTHREKHLPKPARHESVPVGVPVLALGLALK